MRNLTVFLYHDIRSGDPGIDRDEPEDLPYVIDSQSFRSQLRCLSVNRLQVLSLTEVVQLLRRGDQFKSPTVCLTFDDGHVTNFTHAFPMLREFGYRAGFFITVDRVGSRGWLSWRQIRRMAENGMEIGSHGLTHVPMASLSVKEVVHQLMLSKRILEDRLGVPIKFFSSPTGFADPRLVRIAGGLGYEAVCVGPVARRREAKGPLLLTRIDIKSGLGTGHYARLAARKMLLVAANRSKEEILLWFKTLFGFRGYDRVRGALLSWKAAMLERRGRGFRTKPRCVGKKGAWQ